MKIENVETRAEVKNVCLFLNKKEAAELRDTLNALIQAGDPGRHEHVPSNDYSREITVVVTG
jgi:hypothetical protein